MATPEEFLEERAQAFIRAGELRGRIVRADSWDQLFTSPEGALADFQKYLVNAWRFYYIKEKADDPSVQYTVEPHPNGEIHKIRQNGLDTTYQRLPNGDVAQTFFYPDRPK